MELQKLIFHSCFLLILISDHLVTGYGYEEGEVEGSSSIYHHQKINKLHHHEKKVYTKLFVFGDSYADTGNNRKSVASSWKVPYGLTFPGKPAGRFSDGRVLTDYLAKFLGIKSPIPYQWRKFAQKKLHYGMNFAYGGTGVFDTLYMLPNMTAQIDSLEKLMVNDSGYTMADLQSSLVLVTLSGNDYNAYYAKGGTAQGLQSFITLLVNQLALNLQRIHAMGAKKVTVTALQPLGCLPRATAVSSFQQCNSTENTAVNFHNLLLQQAVARLNNQGKSSVFTILDLYSSFTTVLSNTNNHPGYRWFVTTLKPCCMGISSEYFCGSMDEKGVQLYTVCDNPESAFFWDNAHPTQAGWHAVYSVLKSTLEQLY